MGTLQNGYWQEYRARHILAYKIQEAMESSAFPGKIKINLMQLKTYKLMKISNNTKNCTKAVFFSLET